MGHAARRSAGRWKINSEWSSTPSNRSAWPDPPGRRRCESRSSDDPDVRLFGKLYARSHLRADRWYKLGRELLYGRLEDEKPFHTVRRLVQQEDYALHKLHLAGLPTPRPYGFVEVTPEREYLLVTEFFDHATELGQADIDERVVDDGLAVIRKLWDSGLAHRDIKPANLLVRDGHLLLIDVAFVQARPSPWRQAVDLANMMLCLALRSDPQLVYQRAQRQFSVAEISEAFAAARGLALPSQLRRMLREQGRDLHAEFLGLLPARPQPIRIQRWSARRIALLTADRAGGDPAHHLASGPSSSTATPPPRHSAARAPVATSWNRSGWKPNRCPSASLVPCVRSLPEGWTLGAANVRNGWSRFTLDHDRLGKPALVVRLTAACDTTGATPTPSDAAGTRRYERAEPGHSGPATAHRVPRRLRHRRPPIDQRHRRLTPRSGRVRHRLHHPPRTFKKHSNNAPTGDSTSTHRKRNENPRAGPLLPVVDLGVSTACSADHDFAELTTRRQQPNRRRRSGSPATQPSTTQRVPPPSRQRSDTHRDKLGETLRPDRQRLEPGS